MGIPATGKLVSAPGIIIYRLADGNIVEQWMRTDDVGMLQQPGVMLVSTLALSSAAYALKPLGIAQGLRY